MAGFVYQRNKSRRTAVLGAVLGAVAMAVASIPVNYFLTYPAYVVIYGMPLDTIIGMYQAILPSAGSLLECLGHLQYALDPGQGPAGRGAVYADLQAPVAHPARPPLMRTS